MTIASSSESSSFPERPPPLPAAGPLDASGRCGHFREEPSAPPRRSPPAPSPSLTFLPSLLRLRLGPRLRLRSAARAGRPAGAQRPGRRSRWRARAGAPHSGAAPGTALLRARRGGDRGPRGAGTAAWPLPSLPSPKLRSPPGPDSLMIQRILLGRPGRGAGAGAEQLGRRAGAETGARAGIRAATEAAAAPRAHRPLPSGGGSRCMGPGGRPGGAERRRRRRRSPQAGWG